MPGKWQSKLIHPSGQPEEWEEWINLVLGVWIAISPFILGFKEQPLVMWNHVIIGGLIVLDALGAMAQAAGRRIEAK